jgi:hypothetical protein
MSTAVTLFTLIIPESPLKDLKRRLEATRWSEREPVNDWSKGRHSLAFRPSSSIGVRATTGGVAKRYSTSMEAISIMSLSRRAQAQ